MATFKIKSKVANYEKIITLEPRNIEGENPLKAIKFPQQPPINGEGIARAFESEMNEISGKIDNVFDKISSFVFQDNFDYGLTIYNKGGQGISTIPKTGGHIITINSSDVQGAIGGVNLGRPSLVKDSRLLNKFDFVKEVLSYVKFQLGLPGKIKNLQKIFIHKDLVNDPNVDSLKLEFTKSNIAEIIEKDYVDVKVVENTEDFVVVPKDTIVKAKYAAGIRISRNEKGDPRVITSETEYKTLETTTDKKDKINNFIKDGLKSIEDQNNEMHNTEY